MSNILIVPNSGSIYFSTGLVGSSTIPNLSSGVAFQFDNSAGVNITSYATGINDNDRFSVDGYNGRLFNVSDNLTGVIFSVNDAAGLPIIEVDSSTVDKITMGTYASNTFVINDNRVGIGTGVPAAKLDIFDNVLAGSAGLAGSALNISQTWNTTGTPTALKINVNDIASGPASFSRLFDVVYNGTSYLNIIKDGQSRFAGLISANGLVNNSTTYLRMQSPVITFGNADQTSLRLEDTHVFALRGTVNAQTLRIYNTYTNPINFERLNLKWDTNVLKIGTEKGTEGGVARAMEFQTDGATRMTVTSAGNIGIGTTTPQTFFDINGSTRVGSFFYIDRNGGNNTTGIQFSSRGATEASNFGNPIGNGAGELIVSGLTGLIIGNQNATPLVFGTNNLERVRVTAAGLVGIGTTSPTNLLHIYSLDTLGKAQLLVQNDTDTTQPAIQLLRRRASGAAVNSGNILGRIEFAAAKSSSVNLGAGFIEFQANASPAGFSNVLPSKINFVTFANDAYVTHTNSLVNGAFVAGGITGQFIFNKNDNISGDYGPDTGISRLSAGKIGIGNATAGSSGGTLIAGSIGIGTTTPASKLTVTGGDIEITDVTGGVIFKTPDGTKRYRMTIDNAGAPVFTLLA